MHEALTDLTIPLSVSRCSPSPSYQLLRNCEGSKRKCQSKGIVNLELQVVSKQPKAFIIPKFLSDFEAQEIINQATPKIYESTVGNKDAGGARKSDTRTSRNAWVGRESSEVINSIYRRAADLLKIDEKMLNSNENAEEMQVVHYVNGQKYDNHHDWGVSGYPESRFITLLLYLTEPEEGGETAFPKGADGQGFKVKPKKGMAVLFYNLLEDGNADDLALHAALPVFKGEKWLANFWVWDPKRR
jgi:prolyl 4-hydroxylase